MQRARIDHADLSDADKHLILRDNALKVFGSKLNIEQPFSDSDLTERIPLVL